MARLTLSILALAAAAATSLPSRAFVAVTPNAVITTTDSVSSLGTNQWHFGYTLTNATQCLGNCSDTLGGVPMSEWLKLASFAVPLFADAGVTAIADPAGWSHAIQAAAPWSLGAQTLVWTANSTASQLALGASLSGFGFDAAYGAGKGPFEAVLRFGTAQVGDPAIPLSPLAQAAGVQPLTVVPEPSAALLLAAGMAGGLAFRAARRRVR